MVKYFQKPASPSQNLVGGGGELRDVLERYDTCTELVVIYRTDMTAQRYVEE